MTATERIRAMLDERGVEWTEPNNMARSHTTYWTAGFLRCGAVEFNDGMVSIASSSDDITPEQAIEATLADHRYDDKVFETLNAANDRLIYENMKLRELVLELYEDQCIDGDRWKYRDRMRELGVEV